MFKEQFTLPSSVSSHVWLFLGMFFGEVIAIKSKVKRIIGAVSVFNGPEDVIS